MTLESTINMNRYIGNGATKTFAYTFKVWEKSEVAVWLGDGVSEREVSSACEIQVTSTGGDVTFPYAPASGQVIVIKRAMPYIQEDDYLNGTRFNPEEVEDRFDMDCAERQDLKLELGRTVRLPYTSSLSPDDLVEMLLQAIEDLKNAGDVSGSSLIKALGTSVYRSLAAHLGDIVNLKNFGAVGDGSADDSAAWAAWQAALAPGGIGYIPAGRYLVDGVVRTFVHGCFGNGIFDESIGYWNQVRRNPTASVYDDSDNTEDETILQHRARYNASDAVHGPIIKTQADIEYNMTTADNSYNFTRVVGAYHEAVGHGNYLCSADNQTGNFTCLGVTTHNKFAGQFGMGAITGRVWDADETDVPGINVTLGLDEETGRYVVKDGYGASKSCAGYFPFTRKARHRNGGYMIGIETFCFDSSNETLDIPYENSDTFTFRREPDKPGFGGAWTCGFHCTAYGGSMTAGKPKGAPISAGIMLDAAADARHGFWNGIVIGQSCMKINGQAGVSGTVGINFASWRTAAGYGDQAIRFGHANEHLHFKEGARIWSPQTVIGFDGDDGDDVQSAGLTVMAPEGGQPFLSLATGTLNGERSRRFGITVFATNENVFYNLHDGQSHVFGFTAAPVGGGDPETTYVYNLNSGFFTCSGEQQLGTATTLWGQIFSTNSTISTSDERIKQDIDGMPDELLDAWGGIDWLSFRFKDAVAKKGDAEARVHTGLIAQRVKAVLEDAGIDAVRYGFLCHDEWDDVYEPVTVVDVPAHVNGRDELVPDKMHEEMRLVKPAGDLWTLRYEEALCIEAAYVRRELARIKAQIGMD